MCVFYWASFRVLLCGLSGGGAGYRAETGWDSLGYGFGVLGRGLWTFWCFSPLLLHL